MCASLSEALHAQPIIADEITIFANIDLGMKLLSYQDFGSLSHWVVKGHVVKALHDVFYAGMLFIGIIHLGRERKMFPPSYSLTPIREQFLIIVGKEMIKKPFAGCLQAVLGIRDL